MTGVGVGEKDVQLAPAQLAVDRVQLALELAGQLGIVLGQLVQLDQVLGLALEPVPGLDLLPEVGRLAPVPAGLGGVVPDAGLG